MPRIRARFRTRLERERRAAQLSQMDLARLAKVNQATVSKLENQLSPRPGLDVLASLAWALNKFGRKVSAEDFQPRRRAVLAVTSADRRRRKSA